MKSINQNILTTGIFIVAIFLLENCSKNDASIKGCTDIEAVNYKADATVSNDNCTYAPDKMAGSWNVSENESKTDTTINYTATITKIDNKTINIKNKSDYPSPVPSYHVNNMTMQIEWSTKSFVQNANLTGMIYDVNKKWDISYTDSSTGTVYKVKQTYTR